MTSKTFFYARVSTKEQNLDRQIAAFKAMPEFDERNLICDKASGKNFDRPEYQNMKQRLLRDGDVLVIMSLDRLGRDKAAMAEELDWMRKHNIRLKILDLPSTCVDLGNGMHDNAWILDMVNNILFEVLSSMAEQELHVRARRQREGIDAMTVDEDGKKVSARTGRKYGRPEKGKPENWDAVIAEWQSGSLTIVEMAKKLGMGRTRLYELLKAEGLKR